MWSIIDRIRNWIRKNRTLDYWEIEDLVAQWYDFHREFYINFNQNYNAWYSEWKRLVDYDQFRPHSREKFMAIKADKIAKELAVGTGLYLSVVESCYPDHITVRAFSLKCRDYLVASVDITV